MLYCPIIRLPRSVYVPDHHSVGQLGIARQRTASQVWRLHTAHIELAGHDVRHRQYVCFVTSIFLHTWGTVAPCAISTSARLNFWMICSGV